MAKLPLKVKKGDEDLKQLHAALEVLVTQEVLVGFPEDTTERPDSTEPTNAALGYIHDNGAPEVNIPARPFMLPAMEGIQDAVADMLGAGAKEVLRKTPTPEAMMKHLHRVGFKVENAIKTKINEGIPPPLSEHTLRKRAARGREGAAWDLAWRQAGVDPTMTMELAKPLVDTGEMRNSVKYVIRPRKAKV